MTKETESKKPVEKAGPSKADLINKLDEMKTLNTCQAKDLIVAILKK